MTQVRLTLVRHGRPAVQPAVAPRRWALARDAAEGLARLRGSGLLPSAATWISSPEPKALATAAALTDRTVITVDDLREAERPATWFDEPEEFVAAVRRSFEVPDESAVPGWETASGTRSRVAAIVRELLADAEPPDELVLVGHGTAWTLLVAELTGRTPDLDAWERMAMPDLAILDIPASGAATLVRDWGG
ncbi:MAG TPA: histidine phosphatase family protein [Nocardioidaceae bacterium]|nr:histidine phosphatase family protein [Nocardioidaceae bacterium]